MSGILSSYLIEPALRQVRRFSTPPVDGPDSRPPLSHVEPDQHAFPQAVHDPESPVSSVQSFDGLREPLAGIRPSRSRRVTEPTPTGTIPEGGRDQPLASFYSRSFLQDATSRLTASFQSRNASNSEPSSSLRPNTAHGAFPNHERMESMSLDDDGPRTPRAPPATSSSMERSRGEEISAPAYDEANASLNQIRTRHSASSQSKPKAEQLPADDGMNSLRSKMHQIRDMALSTEERAKRMHELMTEDYRRFKADLATADVRSEGSNNDSDGTMHQSPRLGVGTSRLRSPSPVSDSGEGELLTANDSDRVPTYQPKPQQEDGVELTTPTTAENEEKILGCIHYRRNVKVQCDDCWKWYTCRFCHDEAEAHTLVRSRIRHMLCMCCGMAQKAAEYCANCKVLTACYYCNICKLWDNDPSHSIYHCHDCGICRRGKGLGKDYVHCKRCNVCINITHKETHRCIERATESNCPICGEWMFTSSITVVAVQCGHYMHRPCHDELMKTSFKCPICSRSAVNMELQWRKLDRAIEAQPMPSQFKQTKVWISCNDCSARSYTSFHWLGNRCTVCDSYNTNQLKMINSPTDQELQAMTESREVQALREAERRLEAQDAAATFSPSARRQSQINLAASARRPSAPAAEPSRLAGFPSMTTLNSANATDSRPSVVIDTNLTGQPTTEIFHSALMAPASATDLNSYFAQTPTANLSMHNSVSSAFTDEDLQMASFMTENSDTASTASTANGGGLLSESATLSAYPPDSAATDDIAFWGEPIGTPSLGWQFPSVGVPRMPSVPLPSVPEGWPRVPEGWPRMPSMPDTWPRMPSVGLPSMNMMPENFHWPPRMPSMSMPSMPSMPTMPSMSMPSMSIPEGWSMPSMNFRGASGDSGVGMTESMQRAISPSTIWAAGSPVFSGLQLPSPRFFPLRRGQTRDEEENEDEDDSDYEYEEDDEEESSSESGSEEMEFEMDEDGDVDQLQLPGHR